MAQKSLTILDKADLSLVWTSCIFDKKYKWLSYNLWFSYIQYYKNVFFFNVKFNPLKRYNVPQNRIFFKIKGGSNLGRREVVRFSYHLDLYCIEVFNHLLLLNIYFLVNLEYLKRDIDSTDTEEDTEFFF